MSRPFSQRDHAELARRLGAERAAEETEVLGRLRELLGIVWRLRDSDGCPWDREQTVETMCANLVEEAAETAEAIAEGDDAHIAEELGDTLMNVLLIARIAEQDGRFDLAAVASGIATKLVRRHAHVFGDRQAADADAALNSWNDAKQREVDASSGAPTGAPPVAASDSAVESGPRSAAPGEALSDIPSGLPALQAAQRVAQKAAATGFDWPDATGALDKLREELEELREARESGDRAAIEHELGDVLFAAVVAARKLDVDPELALRRTILRFRKRFARLEQRLGDEWDRAPLSELIRHWREVSAGGDA